MTIKDSKYVKIYSVNSFPLIFNKVNGYFDEINGNKNLTLVHTNESNEKKYEELCSKTRDLIRSITKNSDDYKKIYMKIKFNSYGKLPLNKMTEIPRAKIIVRTIFYENNKYYLHRTCYYFDNIIRCCD